MRRARTIKGNFDESNYTPVRLVLDEERKLSFAEFDEEEEEVPKTKIEQAMEILAEMPKDGSVPVSDINATCAEEGIVEKTAQRAIKRLGAVQDYKDGVSVWEME